GKDHCGGGGARGQRHPREGRRLRPRPHQRAPGAAHPAEADARPFAGLCAEGAAERARAGADRRNDGLRLLVGAVGDGPVPRERHAAARKLQRDPARDPVRGAHAGRPGAAERRGAHGPGRARAGAGDGRDGKRQDVDDGRDDPAHEPALRAPHRHPGRPHRVPSPRQPLLHLAARGGHRHRLVPQGAEGGAPAGPGRDPDRRDARQRDHRDRAEGRRNGAPGDQHAAHQGRHQHHLPPDRRLSHRRAEHGAAAAFRRAARGDLAAPAPPGRRPGPRRGGGGDAAHGHHRRLHPRPRPHLGDPRPHRRRPRKLRDADVRPAPGRAGAQRHRPLRGGARGGQQSGRLRPARPPRRPVVPRRGPERHHDGLQLL
ncbi:MAG: Twitching motility protein PilT, partial [uncultured Gemmatimonadetes bacterium]